MSFGPIPSISSGAPSSPQYDSFHILHHDDGGKSLASSTGNIEMGKVQPDIPGVLTALQTPDHKEIKAKGDPLQVDRYVPFKNDNSGNDPVSATGNAQTGKVNANFQNLLLSAVQSSDQPKVVPPEVSMYVTCGNIVNTLR